VNRSVRDVSKPPRRSRHPHRRRQDALHSVCSFTPFRHAVPRMQPAASRARAALGVVRAEEGRGLCSKGGGACMVYKKNFSQARKKHCPHYIPVFTPARRAIPPTACRLANLRVCFAAQSATRNTGVHAALQQRGCGEVMEQRAAVFHPACAVGKRPPAETGEGMREEGTAAAAERMVLASPARQG